jgi:hypothetical protein
VRAGLHPTKTGCVNQSAGSVDGNMYEPVIPYGAGDGYAPPITGIPTYGMMGYNNSSIGATSPATSKGVRHNGALTLQVVKATIQNSDIEQAIPGHPEYGWRVKSTSYAAQVLAEYTTFWHHPNGICFGESGWLKNPPPDPDFNASSASNLALAATHSDPKIGALGSGGSGATAGTTTTTVHNPDGTTTTTTTTVVINSDGSVTTTTTVTIDNVATTTTTTNTNYTGGPVNRDGTIDKGPPTPTEAIGRINWRELLR